VPVQNDAWVTASAEPANDLTRLATDGDALMVFNPYVVPALFSLVAKLVILYLSRHARVQNAQTRLFAAATVFSIGMSVAEISGLLRLLAVSPGAEFFAYYAASIAFTTLLVHLAFSMGLDQWQSRHFLPIYFLLYGYSLSLEVLLLFTPWLITGFRELQGYTFTRIPGPAFGFYELFTIVSLTLALVVPAYGLRRNRAGIARTRCKLWLAAVAPLCALAMAIIVLLHFEIRWFNATVTAPLLIALLLAGVGYAVHAQRVVDLDSYLPWSRAGKVRAVLVRRLQALERELPRAASVPMILRRLSAMLNCPTALIDKTGVVVAAGDQAQTPLRLPKSDLNRIRRLTIAGEIHDLDPSLYHSLRNNGIAAVMPLVPHSKTARYWLALGEPLSRSLHAPLDIETFEQSLSAVGARLLDSLLPQCQLRLDPQGKHGASTHPRRRFSIGQRAATRSATSALPIGPDKTLEEQVAELEARIIKSVLQQCRGNQATAADRLGMRANTLHYKLKRYGLLID
jgi:hypothetical protein